MRTRSMVGLLALVVAVAVIGAGTAFAQTPVVPAPTSAPPTDDKSKPEKPKVEEPKVEEPKVEQPKVEVPKVEVPKAEEPKAEKPTAEKPKVQEPKPEKPTVQEPKPEKPTAEEPTAEKPKGEKLEAVKPTATPKRPRPAQPKRAHADAPSARPNQPAPEPQIEVPTTASPRPTAAPYLAASGAGAASPHPLGTDSASSGGDSADAVPVASGPATVVPRREPRVASDDVTAAAASIAREQARLLTLDSLPGYNVALLLLALLLAIVFAVGLGYHIRRDLRGPPRTAALRPRASRRRPKVHAFSARVRCSIAAWSAGIAARISTARTRFYGPPQLLARQRRASSFGSGSGMRPGAVLPNAGRRSASAARGRTI